MNDYRRPTTNQSGQRRTASPTQGSRPTSTQARTASSRAKQEYAQRHSAASAQGRTTSSYAKRPTSKTIRPTKRKGSGSGGFRFGGVTIRPRFIALLLAIVIIVGVIIGVVTREPECYEIDYGSITMFETVDAVIIKNETGYSYPEGVTVVSRVPDGTYVEAGDEIAVVRTSTFNTDWYHLLSLAREKTIDYMMNRISPDSPVHETVKTIDVMIETLSKEMLSSITKHPELYSEYSKQLSQLYDLKRTELLKEFQKGDGNLNDLIAKEEYRKAQIEDNTIVITALRSGVVSYNSDGYANVYNFESLGSVTETVYNNILNDENSSAIKNSRGVCDYYISEMSSVFFAMSGDGETFRYLQDNDEAIIRINNQSVQYMATIKDITDSSGHKYVIANASGDFDDYYRDRCASVTLQKTWASLVVPKEHVVKKGNDFGVYIYEDGKKKFARIDILAENETVVVLNTQSPNNVFKKGTQIVMQ